MLTIRNEKPGDAPAIREVHLEAFDTPTEASLVDKLRESKIQQISLVAEVEGSGIVGHILFTPVDLSDNPEQSIIFGLGPMAVKPAHQRKGIGTKLVEKGIERCREAHIDALVVLGHPEFYPRFGFVPSVHAGIRSRYDVPDEVFMLMELVEGSLRAAYGVVRYSREFGGA